MTHVVFLLISETQERLVSEGTEIQVLNENNNWLNPSRIQLRWRWQNLTSGEADRVTIALVGYREDNTKVSMGTQSKEGG